MNQYLRDIARGGILATISVTLAGCMWHGWHGGTGGGHMSDWHQVDQQEKSAVELLDEAYARGEMTREEYLKRRADLERR